MRLSEGGFVSIIMPCFNCANSVSRAIESVLCQTYSYFELIVIDDGSTDETKTILERFKNLDSRVKLIALASNVGVAEARNAGLEVALGDYIAFLDADDYWFSNKLSSQVSILEKGRYFCSHASYYREDALGNRILIEAKSVVTFSDMCKFNHVGNLTGIYKSSELGYVKQISIGHEDYAMWCEIMKKTDSVGLEEPLGVYNVSRDSLSGNKIKAFRWYWRIQRELLGFGFLVALRNSIYLVFHHLNKKS